MFHIHSITIPFNGLSQQITSDIVITNLNSNTSITTKGLWDTGASHSAITSQLAKSIGLTPISKTIAVTANGSVRANVYNVKLTLHNENIYQYTRITECSKLSDENINVLIGMNVINKGDFIISNYNGKTVLTFRIPSIKSYDFVKKHNKKSKIINTIVHFNTKCSCGSGKRYLRCCGIKNVKKIK